MNNHCECPHCHNPLTREFIASQLGKFTSDKKRASSRRNAKKAAASRRRGKTDDFLPSYFDRQTFNAAQFDADVTAADE